LFLKLYNCASVGGKNFDNYGPRVRAIKASTFLKPYDYCYQTFFNLYNVPDTLPY